MGSGRKSGESGPLPQRQARRRLSLRPKQKAAWLAAGAFAAIVAIVGAGLLTSANGGGDAEQVAAGLAPAASSPSEPGAAVAGGSGTGFSQAASQSEPGTGAGGPSEGISVRGSWTIQVFNPDGSLAQRVEFENALRSEGADALAAALAGNILFTGGDGPLWTLFLADLGTLLPNPVPGVSPCTVDRVLVDPSLINGNNAIDTGCWLMPAELGILFPAGTPGIGTDLTGVIVSDAAGDIFSLTGSVVATQDGVIDFVESFVWVVEVTSVIPPSLDVVDIVDFTGTSLETPVDVVNGQEIQVTFELSFQ